MSTMTMAAVALASLLTQASTPDACRDRVPATLHAAIARSHPGSRLVRESDYDAEDIASERQYHNGSACLGVASADVNGDGRKDFAFLIAANERDTLFVAALATAEGRWKLSTLTKLTGTPRGYFVNRLDAGKYVDLFVGDDAPDEWRPEPGRVRRYTSRTAGFITGGIESSGIAFFFNGTRWVHVWLSD